MSLSARRGHSCDPDFHKEESKMSATQLSITQVGRVIVPVSDQERAVAFYTGVLGLEKRMDVRMGDADRWIEVAPKGQQTSIAIARPPGGNPIGVQTGVSFATTDADGDLAALKAAGV